MVNNSVRKAFWSGQAWVIRWLALQSVFPGLVTPSIVSPLVSLQSSVGQSLVSPCLCCYVATLVLRSILCLVSSRCGSLESASTTLWLVSPLASLWSTMLVRSVVGCLGECLVGDCRVNFAFSRALHVSLTQGESTRVVGHSSAFHLIERLSVAIVAQAVQESFLTSSLPGRLFRALVSDVAETCREQFEPDGGDPKREGEDRRREHRRRFWMAKHRSATSRSIGAGVRQRRLRSEHIEQTIFAAVGGRGRHGGRRAPQDR